MCALNKQKNYQYVHRKICCTNVFFQFVLVDALAVFFWPIIKPLLLPFFSYAGRELGQLSDDLQLLYTF